ncbi:unnamed protein product, partial [Didymodactylos carnosus]
ERITSHARKLAVLFHPDKAQNPNDTVDFSEVFKIVIARKEELLKELKNFETVQKRVGHHTSNGDRLWEFARDFKRARNDEWTNLKHFHADQLKRLSGGELIKNQKAYAFNAYEEFRAATVALGTLGNAEERSKLRRMMAIALYTAEEHLQAQIYAIAALYILSSQTNRTTFDKEIDYLQNLLKLIRGAASPPPPKAGATTGTTSASPTPTTSAVIVSAPGERSSSLILKGQIKEDLRAVVLEQCLIKSNEKQIRTSKELILRVKQRAFQQRVIGTVAGTEVAFIGLGIVGSACESIGTGVAVGSVLGPVGIVIGAVAGVSVMIGGLYLGIERFQSSRAHFQEPKIREELNNKLTRALEHHKQQMYGAFLDELASEYGPKHLALITIEKADNRIKIEVDPKKIISTLLSHEFRPDGIAYLLNLIGDALLNKPRLLEKLDPSLRQPPQSTLNQLATDIFLEIFSRTTLLQARANELDEQVKKKTLTDSEMHSLYLLLRSLTTTLYSSYKYAIPKEYYKDALLTPFTTRLDELVNIARLNYAIANIIIGGIDNFGESQSAISEIKQRKMHTVSNQYFMISDTMIQAIDDLLMAFGFPPEMLQSCSGSQDEVLALENTVVLENVKVVMLNNVAVNCERVKASTRASEQLEALCELCDLSVSITQREFVEKVKKLYEGASDEVQKAEIRKMMIADDTPTGDIVTWSNQHFCSQNWVFSAVHLPVVAKIFDTRLYNCSLTTNSTYGRVFLLSEPTFEDDDDLRRIFVVLDKQSRAIGMFTTCELKLNFLKDELNTVQTNELKLKSYHKIAVYYRLQAAKYENIHHLQALPKWNSAKDNYISILELDSNDLLACLGYGRCLIMLSKYTKAQDYLCKVISVHDDSAEAWYLLGVARRKLRSYDEAKYAIDSALNRDQTHKDAANELKIILALKSTSTKEDRMNAYNVMKTSSLSSRSKDGSLDYNILTVDGGGIRGLISAVWLAEIERRTNRSASSMFQMMAGTSTGAIIAAGLCTPERGDLSRARYQAAELVQLYVTRSDEIFKKRANSFYNFRSSLTLEPKYLPDARHKLFKEHFDHTQLSHVLTELVIPAVKSDCQVTHLFTRYKARKTRESDHFLHDVLMCTTAAPTYFPPYKIHDDNCFYVDGGVQMNNPVRAAYNEALHYGKKKENLFILSLGTGDYVPDPLDSNANRHLLYYALNQQKILNIIFDGPQYNTDVSMLSDLKKDQYQRWQIYFEEPVALDSIEKSSIEFLFDSAQEFLEEMDAYDNDERLGLLLDRLKGDAH